MLTYSSRRQVRGYSLVEALVVLIIMAVLLAKGIPAFQQTIASMRVRDTAESIQTGIRLAQGTAIRQNANVLFQLTYAPGGNQANCTLMSDWTDITTHVTNWVVSLTPITAPTNTTGNCNSPVNANPAVGSGDPGLLQIASVDQGNRVGISTIQYMNDGTTLVSPAPTQVCFNSMGTFCQGVVMPVKINVVDKTFNGGRSLQVCAMPGGVKMCDPNLTSTTDPMACSADPHFC